MKKREEKMSEILAQAVKLLNDAEKACAANYEMMKEQDAKTQDLLHKLELENLTRDQRATLSTQLRDCPEGFGAATKMLGKSCSPSSSLRKNPALRRFYRR